MLTRGVADASNGEARPLVEAAIKQGEVIPLMFSVLEAEKLEGLVDASGAKARALFRIRVCTYARTRVIMHAQVHAVTVLKLLEDDALHGPAAAGVLAEHRTTWERYARGTAMHFPYGCPFGKCITCM